MRCFAAELCNVLDYIRWSFFFFFEQLHLLKKSRYFIYSLFITISLHNNSDPLTLTLFSYYKFYKLERTESVSRSCPGEGSSPETQWRYIRSASLLLSVSSRPNGRPLQHDSFNLILIKYCNNAGSSCCRHD